VIVAGRYAAFAEGDPQVMAYTRTLGDARLAVVANVSGREAVFDVPEAMAVAGGALCPMSRRATGLPGG
jgi:trehalose-6-phosphate hydrolase